MTSNVTDMIRRSSTRCTDQEKGTIVLQGTLFLDGPIELEVPYSSWLDEMLWGASSLLRALLCVVRTGYFQQDKAAFQNGRLIKDFFLMSHFWHNTSLGKENLHKWTPNL